MEQEQKSKLDARGRIISIIVLALMLITVWYMLDLVLLTFILTFIFYHVVELSQRQYRKVLPFRIPDGLILTVAYLLFIGILVILSNEFVPKLVEQVTGLANELIRFDFAAVEAVIDPAIAQAIGHIDFNYYISQAGSMITSTVTTAGSFAFHFFISLILSFVLLVEKGAIREFGANMATSKISFIYEYFVNFGGSFCKTFGKVMSVQVIIALVNCGISMIGLTLIGFSGILGLGFMIFCLGLIPVAGVVISLFPLCTIAFTLGGVIKVIEVLIMVMVIHAIEAYILNPKLMSHKTRLPVCFTFMILLISEHYLGVWGLLIGVPIFIFLMNIFEVDYEIKKKEKEEKKKIKTEDAQKE